MFNKLQIRNFRKNVSLDIDLDQITVLVGSNAQGKSSLVGAIKWLCFNSPAGTDFIHWGKDYALVRLLDTKNTITRKRSKTDNYYRLNNQKLKAMGSNVPEPISKVLNISELNFHRQQAGPFWFRETAGEVSRQLNAIVNLDLIDTTLSNLDKLKRENNAEKNVVESRIKEAKNVRNKLSYIFDINKRLKVLESKQKQYEEGVEKINELEGLYDKAKELERSIKVKIPDVKPLLKLCKTYKSMEEEYQTLQTLFNKAKELEESNEQLFFNIENNEQELHKLIGKKCPLCQQKIK